MSQHRERIRAKVAAVLADAEAVQPGGEPFHPLGILEVLQMAAMHGVALPPRMGAQVSEALRSYLASECATLDDAFGVTTGRGGTPLRTQRARDGRWSGLCVEMNILRAIGTTREQAAAMVKQKHGLKSVEVLDHHYRTKRMHSDLGELGALALTWHHTEVAEILAEYPDSKEAREARARVFRRISARYPPGWHLPGARAKGQPK